MKLIYDFDENWCDKRVIVDLFADDLDVEFDKYGSTYSNYKQDIFYDYYKTETFIDCFGREITTSKGVLETDLPEDLLCYLGGMFHYCSEPTSIDWVHDRLMEVKNYNDEEWKSFKELFDGGIEWYTAAKAIYHDSWWILENIPDTKSLGEWMYKDKYREAYEEVTPEFIETLRKTCGIDFFEKIGGEAEDNYEAFPMSNDRYLMSAVELW